MASSSFQLKQPDISSFVPEEKELWSDDKLGRKTSAERLVNMVSGQNGPLTIGLNGRWGEGKTFFLKRFQKQYEDVGGRTIYFNAWQDDFLDDPLLSLLCQLREALGNLPNESLVNCTKLLLAPALKHIGLSMVKSFVRNTAKIDLDSLSLNDIATKGESLFSEYENACAARTELTEALGRIATEVKKLSKKPLVVIVDELDRCRPSFSVEMLERIKHLFSVENIVFILGFDKIQLSASIAAIYGNIDAQGYLDRFVDVEILLPKVSLCEFIKDNLTQSDVAEFIGENNGRSVVDGFSQFFSAIADAEQLPPRAVEHALRRFALVAFSHGAVGGPWNLLAAYAVGLSMLHDKTLYIKFLKGECQPKEIIDTLFPYFDISYPYQNPNGVDVIRFLYTVWYHAIWDSETKDQFNAILMTQENLQSNSFKMSLLPSFVEKCSPKDICAFFSQVTLHHDYSSTFRTLLCDLRETMSTIVAI